MGKGQSAVELLVILGIMVLVASVAVVIYEGFMDPSGAKIIKSKVYWMGMSYGVQLQDWMLSVMDDQASQKVEANFTVVIKNPRNDMITIKEINIEQGDFSNVWIANTKVFAGKSDSLNLAIAPKGTIQIIIQHFEQGSDRYVPLEIYEFDTAIVYQTADGLEMTQKGSLPIVGKKQTTQGTLTSGCAGGTEECPDTSKCCPIGFCSGGNICSSTIKNCNSTDPFNVLNQFCVQAGCPTGEYCNASVCQCVGKETINCADGVAWFNRLTMICSDDCEDSWGTDYYCNETTCECEERIDPFIPNFCQFQDDTQNECNYTFATDPIYARNKEGGNHQDCCLNNILQGGQINETCMGLVLRNNVWSQSGNSNAGCCVNNTYDYCDDSGDNELENVYCCPGLVCNNSINKCISAEFVCQDNYVLISGRHPLDTYTPPTEILVGSQCELSSHCGAGQYCHQQSFTCQPCPAPGDDCIIVEEGDPYCCPKNAMFCNESGKCEGTYEPPIYEIASAFCCHEDFACEGIFYSDEYFLYGYPPAGSLQLQTSCCVLPDTKHTFYDHMGATQCLCCKVGESVCSRDILKQVGGIEWEQTVAICCPVGECYEDEDGNPTCCGEGATELQKLPYSQGNKCCAEGEVACDIDLCCEEGTACTNLEVGVLGINPPVIVPVETEPYCCPDQYSCSSQPGLCCNAGPSFECKDFADNGQPVQYCCSSDIENPVLAQRKIGSRWITTCCDSSNVKDGICCPQEAEACGGSCCSSGNCQTIDFEYDRASYSESLCCEEGQVGYQYSLPSGYTAVNPPNTAIGNVILGCCDENKLASLAGSDGAFCCPSADMQIIDNKIDYYCCPSTRDYYCSDNGCCENECVDGHCCPAGMKYYCTDGCCEHACVEGYCSECPSGQTSCAQDLCCNDATQTCINKGCCSKNKACGTECCTDEYTCAQKDEKCCSEKKICEGHCCTDNQICNEKTLQCENAQSCERIEPKGDSRVCSAGACPGGACRYNEDDDKCECPCGATKKYTCEGYCMRDDSWTYCDMFETGKEAGCTCAYGHDGSCGVEPYGVSGDYRCSNEGSECHVTYADGQGIERMLHGTCTTWTPPNQSNSYCYCVENIA